MLLNRNEKCCMIHAPPFCGNVYIGTPWVLSHPEVIVVNKDPVVFFLVSAIPLFRLVLFDMFLVCFSLVCELMCFLAL